MTDIITRAKRLLEHATPGPWSFQPWSKYTGPNGDYEESALLDSDGETLCDGLPDSEGELIALAPELAKTVADMHWEYAVQFKSDVSGEWFTNGFYGHGMHGQQWFGSREEAEQQITREYPPSLVEPREYRIIRRPVSDEEIMG